MSSVPPQPEPYKTALPGQNSSTTFLHQQQAPAAPTDYYHGRQSAILSHQPQIAPGPAAPGGVRPQSYPPQLSQTHNSASTTAYSQQLSPHSPHHQYPQQQPVTQPGAHLQAQAQISQPGYGLQPPTAYGNYYQAYGDNHYQVPPAQPYSPQQFYGTSGSGAQQQPSHSYPEDQATLVKPEPQQSQSENMPPRRSAASSSAQPPAIEPSPVKTKFPTARIKRIMQADEEVGKVAQQTPIAVGKALEMFMIHIVTKSAEVAKEKNSKRVTAAMLKQVVEGDEQWDFLREIVSKVDVEQAGKGGKAKAESESEEEVVEKKKKRGGRKKAP
ncbi:hypothetical protein GE09DRAFT_106755 [Coniochaeta sp. 2T2.1]|nr:hypothetical protein GE09DRAFT_106755 [Coniochaeta sp. 2T2.1]